MSGCTSYNEKSHQKTTLTTIPPKAIKLATDKIQQTLEPQGEASHPENTSLRDLDKTVVKAQKSAIISFLRMMN